MQDPINQDFVTKWQRLMNEWEAASAEYGAALANPADEPTVMEALHRLDRIKDDIDALIRQAQGTRTPVDRKDGLLVGTIEVKSAVPRTGEKADAEGKRHKATG